MGDLIRQFADSTGLANMDLPSVAMIAIGGLLIFLAIVREYEPLLLIPIGFSAILVNLPGTGLIDEGGLLSYIFFGIKTGIFPPLVFLGLGAMTDFGPLLSKPQTFLLGAAAQFGIFATLIGARAMGFTLEEASAVAIIGGADGPTAIYVASELAPHLLGAVSVAAYSYMALVPIIQPPIIRLLTSKRERTVVMSEMRPVPKQVRVLFPIGMTLACALLVPASAPLIGMLMLGNLLREAGVVDRLAKSAQNEISNIVMLLLGLSVGSKMTAGEFLTIDTLRIIALGLVAFALGTAAGVLLGKLMNVLSGGKINPMIGAAGVSAVPMAARVVQRFGQRENPRNFLLMNAMGPNFAGVIGSAVAAGVLLSIA